MTPLFLLMAALSSASGSDDGRSGVTALEPYRWHNRLVVIFAPNDDDPRYLEQQRLLGQVSEGQLTERDLLIFSCFAESGFVVGAESGTKQTFGKAEADALRQALDPGENDFQVLLMGKDGGVKRREGVPVTSESLLEQIDSMPMRQQEMNTSDE